MNRSGAAAAGSDARYGRYSRDAVLAGKGTGSASPAAPWAPGNLDAASAATDYVADSEVPADPPRRFRTLQAAIDCAVRDAAHHGAQRRRSISLRAGFYQGPVYIPAAAPPLTILGAGAGSVTLAARIDAEMPGREYESRFGPQFAAAAPAMREIFARIAARERISTGNTAVLRIERDDTVIAGLTIRNDYGCDRTEAAPAGEQPDASGRFARGQHQAVALHVAGADRIHLSELRLTSFQDTLYLQASAGGGPARTYLGGCTVEGDVDFIFGGATGFFEGCEIRSRGERGAAGWAVAPSTAMRRPYGFVFDRCRFTHDGAEAGQTAGSYLGRQWFEGVRATPYGVPTVPGYRCEVSDVSRYHPPVGRISRQALESVGKCTVLNSSIGPHIDPARPWDDWAGGVWSPRYRPVQATAADFLYHLSDWLVVNGLDYSGLDPAEPWLQLLDCRSDET